MTGVATETGEVILAANFRQLVRLRWFVIGGCVLLLLTAARGFGLVTSAGAGWAALATYTLANLGALCWLRVERAVGNWFFAANLGLDLLLIGAFLAATGGAANPFTLLFLLPVVVAAATLTSGPIWTITLLAGVAYTLLLVQFPATGEMHHAVEGEFDRHVLGMWLGLIFVAALVAYFAAWMGQALRRRERELADARERRLRDERVLALGALAASAAHELGTPLSTMAVLSGELAHSVPVGQRAAVDLLRTQIERCKQVLSSLGREGDQLSAESGRAMSPTELFRLLAEQTRQLRPETPVQWSWLGPEPEQMILVDLSLLNALNSFINNAADASPSIVALHGRCDQDQVVIEIEDRGPGVERDLMGRLGRVPVTTKGERGGLGIGALLAHAVIERLGGRIWIRDRDSGTAGNGTRIEVHLPLQRLGIGHPGDPAISERDHR